MKFNNCPLRNELKKGLLQYKRDTNISPISLIESLVEEFLYKRGYLVVGGVDEVVPFPTELNQPHIKYTYVTKEGKLQIQKSINKKTYVYGTCEYNKANEIISFLKSKNWDIKYSTNQTKLKAGKQIEFLLNEMEKENKMSCFYCKHYAGLEKYCMRAVYITNGSESLNCDEYEYNGEVKKE